MFNWLDKTPYPLLMIDAVFMVLAPFKPMPHVMEKLVKKKR